VEGLAVSASETPWRGVATPSLIPSWLPCRRSLTGHQSDVADDRVLATVLFTDIVDSTRRAAEMRDRDWHALLDAHDAIVWSQFARFRGREVNTSGDGFLAMSQSPTYRPRFWLWASWS
jgi:class 3 adenylate cyclase